MNKNLPANTNLDTPQDAPTAEPTDIPSPSARPFPRKVQKNILLLLPVVLLLFAGIALVLLSQQKTQDVRSRAAAGGTTLAIAPATKTVAVGESFAVGATMNTGMDTVSAATLHLSYDPAALDIVSFTPGTVLPVVLMPENHTNGVLSVTLGASPTSPFKGADIVGTWTMKVRAAKQSSIQFTDATAVAALGKTANALAGASGTTITVTASGTPSATPIRRTTVIPLPTSRPTLIPVGCSPNGSTCTIPYCPPMPPCPVGMECTQVMPPCSDQTGICENNQCVPYTSVAPIPTRTPIPPPGGCYYQEVECFMPPCAPVLVCPTPTTVYLPTRTPTRMPTPVVGTNPCAGVKDGTACTDTCARACPPDVQNCIDLCTTREGVCINQRCETWLTPTPRPTYMPSATPTPVWHPWWWNWWDNWRHGRSWWRR
jgi:hypothetical protein